MHEMGIAAGVLDVVRQYVPEAQAAQVRVVRLRVGELAGVQVDSLRFCFEAIVAGTSYQSAALAIEYIPAERLCRQCGARFAGMAMLATCPGCGATGAQLVGGGELAVAEVELADDPDDSGQVMP